MRDNERAASIAISHALTIAITAILITTLLLATGNFLQTQQERVAADQLRDIGGDLASLIDRADRLNATGEHVSVELDAEYPNSVTGSPYNIGLIPDSGTTGKRATLSLDSPVLDRSITVPVTSNTPMERSFARGENPTVLLCPNGGGSNQTIALRSCSP